MPQKNAPRRVRQHQQVITAPGLSAAGASYRQIAEQLSVSKTRAYQIVSAALD
jgi:hypothetical protein